MMQVIIEFRKTGLTNYYGEVTHFKYKDQYFVGLQNYDQWYFINSSSEAFQSAPHVEEEFNLTEEDLPHIIADLEEFIKGEDGE